MSKKAVIRCILSVLLLALLVAGTIVANDMHMQERCTGIDITVADTGNHDKFVDRDDVAELLKQWGYDCTGKPITGINLQAMEEKLNAVDKIERANVTVSAGNRVQVMVTPMNPIARVFDRNNSYYINREGKTMTANANFKVDVPIVCGTFNAEYPATNLIPLLEKISNDKNWNALVAQIIVEPADHDVILVPMLRGHVINLGDTENLDDKLQRVMMMYHQIMPIKGWTYYDTISVKWKGQIVGLRREKSIPEPLILFDQKDEAPDEEDLNSMLIATDVDTVGMHSKEYQTVKH